MIYRLEKNAFRVEEYAKKNNLFLFPYHPESGSRPVLISCKLGFLMVERRRIRSILQTGNTKRVVFREMEDPIQTESDQENFSERIPDAIEYWNHEIYTHLGSVEAEPVTRIISSVAGGLGFATLIGAAAFLVCSLAEWNPLAALPIGGAVFPFSSLVVYGELYTKLSKQHRKLWRRAYQNSLEPHHGFNEKFFRYCMEKESLEVYRLSDWKAEKERQRSEKIDEDAIESKKFSDTAKNLNEKYLKRNKKRAGKKDPLAELEENFLQEYQTLAQGAAPSASQAEMPGQMAGDEGGGLERGMSSHEETAHSNAAEDAEQQRRAAEERREKARTAIQKKVKEDYKSINRSKNTLTKYLWYTDPLIKSVEHLQGIAQNIISYMEQDHGKIDGAVKFVSVYQAWTNQFLKDLVHVFSSGAGHGEKKDAKHKAMDYLEKSAAVYQQEFENISGKGQEKEGKGKKRRR